MNTAPPKQALPWQASPWSAWLERVRDQRMPHAVLITGMAGLGKGHLAEAFAHAVLCQSESSHKPCGTCKACHLLAAASHPDLRQVEPEQAGKAIKIDQIRDLVQFLSATAQQGGWKCVLIKPAEAMNSNAANALLKSLEEPPRDTLIVLVSAAPGRLMATLRSRCQQIAVNPPSREEALQWLQPRVGAQAEALLNYAHGAPCAALEAYESQRLDGQQELLAGLLALAEGRGSAVATAKTAQALEALEAIDQILALLNRLAKARQAPELGEQIEAEWQGIARELNSQWLFRFRDKLLQAKSMILGGANPNHQLLWEEIMLDWQALTRRRTASPGGRALL